MSECEHYINTFAATDMFQANKKSDPGFGTVNPAYCPRNERRITLNPVRCSIFLVHPEFILARL